MSGRSRSPGGRFATIMARDELRADWQGPGRPGYSSGITTNQAADGRGVPPSHPAAAAWLYPCVAAVDPAPDPVGAASLSPATRHVRGHPEGRVRRASTRSARRPRSSTGAPAMDRGAGRADDPDHQAGNRQTLSSRKPRPASNAPRRPDSADAGSEHLGMMMRNCEISPLRWYMASPPCAFAIALMTERPSPDPFAF